MKRPSIALRICSLVAFAVAAMGARTQGAEISGYLIKPLHVFDGESADLKDNWAVLIREERIVAVGPATEIKADANTKTIELPGATLLPGLIDAHSHILLHPYEEVSWDDQVSRESTSLRVARATVHLR